MAVRTSFTAGEVLAAADLTDTFGAKANTSALTSKANLASPAFTGTPTAPTAGLGTNTTQLATTAFVLANGPASGLTHINTTTFSAVSSVSLNNVFTSTYDYYRVLFEFKPSTATTHTMRMRVGGADSTSVVYANISQRQYSTAVTQNAGSVGNSIDFTYGPWGTEQYIGQFEFYNPAKASNTGWINTSATWTTSAIQIFNSGFHKSTTVFDGFSFIGAAGNFTGIIRVYGYKNS